MSDWKKLRELAEAATPGPWRTTDGYDDCQSGRYDDCVSVLEDASGESVIEHVYYDGHHTIMRPRDARFVAAANPTTILAILDENDSLRAEVERLRASHSETVRMRLADDLVHAEAARDRLAMALDEACDLAEQAAAHQPAEVRTGYYARRIAALRTIGKDGGNG